MRIPLTHHKLIAPEHTLPADIPTRGVVRVVPEDLAEERPERSGAVAASMLKPCGKCGSNRNDRRAGLCDKCMKKSKPKAEAVSIHLPEGMSMQASKYPPSLVRAFASFFEGTPWRVSIQRSGTAFQIFGPELTQKMSDAMDALEDEYDNNPRKFARKHRVESVNEATLTVDRARELGAEVLAELGRTWDAWRERPSWDKRGQSDWYAAPEVKALLGIGPNDRVPQWVKRVKRRDLREGKFSEEQAFDDETYESVGVFIRLPEWLADQWPKNGQDSSPTHVTMLYVGACPQAKYDLVLEAVREVCKGIEPFTMDVSDYGEFVAGKPGVAPDAAMTIAHMIPRVMGGGKDLADLHEKLWAACEKRGVTADHFRDGPFKPHITLSYVKPGADQYDGPRPQGRFDVRYLDLWGEDPESDYGYKRIPLGSASKGGPEKPKAELVTEAGEGDAREIAQVLLKTFKTRRDLLSWLDHVNLDIILELSPQVQRRLNQSKREALIGALAVMAQGKHRPRIMREFRLSGYLPLLKTVGLNEGTMKRSKARKILNEMQLEGTVDPADVVPGVWLMMVRQPVFGDTTQASGGPGERSSRKKVVSVRPLGNTGHLLLRLKGISRVVRGNVIRGKLLSITAGAPRPLKYYVTDIG